MKSARPAQAGSEVGHLDKTLTEITTTAAQRLKKWRTPLIALAVAVVAIQVGIFAVRQARESRHVDLNQQVYDLVQSPESRKEGYVLDPSRLEKLLGEVRGDPLEGHVLRTVAQFYLERAANLKDRAAGRGSLAAGPDAAPDPAAEGRVVEAFDRAVALAEEAARRLPADQEIQAWASLVKTKVAAEKEASWLKTKRKYAPPPLPGTPTDPAAVTPSDPAAVTPTDPAPGAPTDPAPGSGPAPEAPPGKGSG
jgi:hypothetical protein